jgi:hypothetical protein
MDGPSDTRNGHVRLSREVDTSNFSDRPTEHVRRTCPAYGPLVCPRKLSNRHFNGPLKCPSDMSGSDGLSARMNATLTREARWMAVQQTSFREVTWNWPNIIHELYAHGLGNCIR